MCLKGGLGKYDAVWWDDVRPRGQVQSSEVQHGV